MSKKLFFGLSLLIFLQFIYTSLYSQDYRIAVGARFGYGWGVSVKGLVGENGHVLEGMLRYGYHGVIFTQPGANISVMYEKHFPFGRNQNWAFLIGAGPQIGFGKEGVTKLYSFGFSPIVGLDVTARRLPFNFSFDYKPSIYMDRAFNAPGYHDRKFLFYEVGLGVRYAIQGSGKRHYR
jgi:hypothetical protein